MGCLQVTVGGIDHICFKQWFQIAADAHPGVPKDQNVCENSKILIARSTIQPILSEIKKPLKNTSKFLKKWQIVIDFTQRWVNG